MNRSVDENPPRASVEGIERPTMQPKMTQPKFGRIDASLAQVEEAIEASKQHIFSMQQEDGHWVGELEADGMLEADYIFLHVLLETPTQNSCTDAARAYRDAALPERRWKLEHLSGRSGKYQPGGKVLLRLQADGHVGG